MYDKLILLFIYTQKRYMCLKYDESNICFFHCCTVLLFFFVILPEKFFFPVHFSTAPAKTLNIHVAVLFVAIYFVFRQNQPRKHVAFGVLYTQYTTVKSVIYICFKINHFH